MNAHQAVVRAVVDRLKADPALADEVNRARRRPIEEGVQTAVNVYFAGSLPQRGAIRGAPIDWQTIVRFECLARGSFDQTPDEVALELHAKAWERLMGDQSLGGLAMDMVPGQVDTDDDELDSPIGCAVGTVQIVHRTASNTLEPVT